MANIIIVGGGVAGLSAGIYAQKRGHHAVIYERHTRAGGNLTGWNRGGYHIDNCIHWLTGTNPSSGLYSMWKDLGVLGTVPVYQAETLYTFERDGQRLSLSRDLGRVKADMLRISPDDREEICSLIAAVETVQRMDGIGGEGHNEGYRPWQTAKAVPHLLRYYRMTTGDLSRRFVHPLLRGFIGSFITEQFSAFALLVVFATFTGGNGGIPVGSSCAMAERMTARYLSLGGRLYTGQGVSKINLTGRRAQSVTLENGDAVAADYVIVTADPAVVFGSVLPAQYMPKALARAYDHPRLHRFSSCHCAFACDLAELPFRGDLIFEVEETDRQNLCGEALLVREFSHEKGFSPEGKSIIQTMTFCNETVAREFIDLRQNRSAYTERKRRMAADVEDILLRRFPMLEGKLHCLDVWTPATYRRYVDSDMGSYMGFLFSSKYLPRRLSGRIKGLENVVLATQWLNAPGGLPIAARIGMEAVISMPDAE